MDPYANYLPPAPPPADVAQYLQYYQYAVGHPVPSYAQQPAPPFVYDPTLANVEADVNSEEGQEQGNSPPQKKKKAPSKSRARMEAVYKKNPAAPKRFKSPYVHFFQHWVEKRKGEPGPDGQPFKFDVSTHSKLCSQEWKALSAEQRKHWECVSEKEKEAYNKQRDAYNGPWRVATNKVKRKRQGPKRNPSAFFLFVNAKRPGIKEMYPDMKNTEVVKACSELWKTIDDSEKSAFQEEEKKLRAKYHEEMEKWKEQQKELGPEETIDEREAFYPPGFGPAKTSGAFPSRKQRKDPNAPRRPPSAFFLFSNHCRPELSKLFPGIGRDPMMKMLSQKWGEMGDEEKRPFRDHEEQLRQRYHYEVERYKKGGLTEDEAFVRSLASVGRSPERKQPPSGQTEDEAFVHSLASVVRSPEMKQSPSGQNQREYHPEEELVRYFGT